MPPPILFDTGTLRNFAACNSLDVLEALCSGDAVPHWVEAVHSEVRWGSVHSIGPDRTQCRYILSQMHATWLGDPIEPALEEQHQIFAIRTALASGIDDHPHKHLGEAQTIWAAEQLGAVFATDDGPAFAYAYRRLGSHSVVDTVDLLTRGVAVGSLTAEGAADLVAAMRSAQRILRRVHPTPLRPDHFV